MIKIIIDRFEGDFAVVEMENRTMVNMPKILLPEDAKEGDVISITIDSDETKSREKRIKEKMNNLFED